MSKNMLDEKSLILLYKSLIHSHFLYCNPIWSCASNKNLKKLVNIQKKAIRIITKSRYNAHTIPIFKKHEILPLHDEIIFSKTIFMYDYVKNLLPLSFENIWNRNNNNLRNNNLFAIPMSRLKKFEKFPCYDFQTYWNNIIRNNNISIQYSRPKFSKLLKKSRLQELTFTCEKPNCQECN